MKSPAANSELLCDLLSITKDGDWGKDVPRDGFVPYRVIRGADFPAARVGDLSGIPRCYLDAGSVHRRTLQPNDILIETAGGNRDRPTGRTFLVTERLLSKLDLPATCASFCRYMRVDEKKADPRYVYWYLQHLYTRGDMWEHQVQHTGVARFQYTRFAETVPIPLPPRSVQIRVSEVLCCLEEKIELNHRTNETLEAMVRALFKSWFVDFDQVRANREGRPLAGVDKATTALFPDSFQDSALGPIPKGWELRSLEEIARYLNGLALQKYPPDDGPSLPVIKIAQLRKGDSTGADRCNTNLPPDYIVQDGDVLFSWSGSLEVELWCGGPGALNQHLFKVTSAGFPKWFYYLWTLYHLDEFRLIAADKATTMGHIQRGHLTAAKVLIPPRPLLNLMTSVMSPFVEQIIAGRTQSRVLTTLRDALLPRVLSGDLSLSAQVA